MTRYRISALTVGSFLLGLALLAPLPARGASLQMVARSTWGATGVPSYMQMYIYVPDKLATKPAIYVSCHSCGSTATGQIGNIPMAQAAADSYGFILLLPDNPGQNCWDVGTKASLTHDGGGDTQGLAEMVKYTLTKYNADPTRVYIMGGSGGHADTAAGAKLAIVTSRLTAGGYPKFVERVRTITTPGQTVDIVVMQVGLAVNPARTDLSDRLTNAGLPVVSMDELVARAAAQAERSATRREEGRTVAVVEYRDGAVIDTVPQAPA